MRTYIYFRNNIYPYALLPFKMENMLNIFLLHFQNMKKMSFEFNFDRNIKPNKRFQ